MNRELEENITNSMRPVYTDDDDVKIENQNILDDLVVLSTSFNIEGGPMVVKKITTPMDVIDTIKSSI